jgi:hypothetical protein
MPEKVHRASRHYPNNSTSPAAIEHRTRSPSIELRDKSGVCGKFAKTRSDFRGLDLDWQSRSRRFTWRDGSVVGGRITLHWMAAYRYSLHLNRVRVTYRKRHIVRPVHSWRSRGYEQRCFRWLRRGRSPGRTGIGGRPAWSYSARYVVTDLVTCRTLFYDSARVLLY